jgi:hypothetical protein
VRVLSFCMDTGAPRLTTAALLEHINLACCLSETTSLSWTRACARRSASCPCGAAARQPPPAQLARQLRVVSPSCKAVLAAAHSRGIQTTAVWVLAAPCWRAHSLVRCQRASSRVGVPSCLRWTGRTRGVQVPERPAEQPAVQARAGRVARLRRPLRHHRPHAGRPRGAAARGRAAGRARGLALPPLAASETGPGGWEVHRTAFRMLRAVCQLRVAGKSRIPVRAPGGRRG